MRLLILVGALTLGEEAHSRDIGSLSEPERSQIINDIAGLYPEGTEPGEPTAIVAISDVVDGLFVVALNPTIREVPNVLIYRVDDDGAQRVTEGLSLGIELQRTPRLDLHTVGKAVDFLNPTDLDPHFLVASAAANGLQAVPYRRFTHAHEAGATGFFLDKVNYDDLRMALFSEEFSAAVLSSGEGAESCILYDVPELQVVSFSKRGDAYVVEGTTANLQHWTVSFSGVSPEGRLTDKDILAARTTPP